MAIHQTWPRLSTVACINGNLSAVKQRLPEDADLQPFQLLLAAAARYDYSSIVSYPLSKGLKIDCDAPDGAVFCGEPSISSSFSAMAGISTSRERLVRWFLTHGVDPNRANPRGEIPFDAAGGYAFIPVLELLLQNGANIKSGAVLQHAVCGREYIPGRFEVIAFLLERGADINKIEIFLLPGQLPIWGTPLHEAAIGGDERLVKLQLERAADTSVRDTRGWTAMRQTKEHNYEIVMTRIHRHKMMSSHVGSKVKRVFSCLRV